MGEYHPNERLARRFWEALSRGDAGGATACLRPDLVWRIHGDNPFADETKAAVDFLGLMAGFGELVDDLRMEVCDIFPSDRGAVIHYRVVVQQGPNLLECEYLVLMHMQDGLVVDGATVALDADRNDAFWRKIAATLPALAGGPRRQT